MTTAAAFAIGIIVASEVAFLSGTEPLTGWPIFQPTVDDATLVAKRRLLPRAAGQIILIGDSSCMMDLIPGPLTDAGLGRPVNLGTLVSFTFAGFAVLGREALETEPAPTALVVVVLPRAFEITELQAREFDLIGRYLTAYRKESMTYEPSAMDRWSWFARKHRLNIYNPAEFAGSFSAYARALDRSNGAFAEPGSYSGATPADFRSHFQPTSYSRSGFVELAATAFKKGVPVLLWWSPSPSDAVSPEYLTSATEYVERLRDELPNLQVARPAPSWPLSQFGSVTHLTPAGAATNSAQLAQYLKRSLTASVGPPR